MTYYATVTELSDGTQVILRLAVRSSEVAPYISALVPMLVTPSGITRSVTRFPFK